MMASRLLDRWLWMVALLAVALLLAAAWSGYFSPELLLDLAGSRFC